MEKRVHFYVSRKNVLTWLMALCLVGSAVARIVLPCVKGMGEIQNVWSQIVLPVAATLLYVLIVLISGKERFYKTAIPVWMIGIYHAIIPHTFIGNKPAVLLLYFAVLFFACTLYMLVSAGRVRTPWFLLILFGTGMGISLYSSGVPLSGGITAEILPLLPWHNILMYLGAILLVFAIRVHPCTEYHPTWGDRPDGRRVRSLPPMAQISSYFMVERNTCSNLYEESIEITHIDRYIRQKRREGLTDFGINHVLLAAYVRGIAKFPQINRFISGQKVFSRGQDIQYCMVVKKEMTIDAPDTSIKVHLTPYDTAMDVYRKLNAAVESVKASKDLDSSFDNLVGLLTMIPSVIMKFVVWLLKLLDYFGVLPGWLLELSPFHGSLFFTSMGSLGISPVFHHLYDFGNLPIFGAFGCKRKEIQILEDGTLISRKYVDCKFTLDERIVDGYYYAAFFKHYKRILAHPEILDDPPEEVLRDID